jgi:hypothetical protein
MMDNMRRRLAQEKGLYVAATEDVEEGGERMGEGEESKGAEPSALEDDDLGPQPVLKDDEEQMKKVGEADQEDSLDSKPGDVDHAEVPESTEIFQLEMDEVVERQDSEDVQPQNVQETEAIDVEGSDHSKSTECVNVPSLDDSHSVSKELDHTKHQASMSEPKSIEDEVIDENSVNSNTTESVGIVA